jgi:hypothetical protein
MCEQAVPRGWESVDVACVYTGPAPTCGVCGLVCDGEWHTREDGVVECAGCALGISRSPEPYVVRCGDCASEYSYERGCCTGCGRS